MQVDLVNLEGCTLGEDEAGEIRYLIHADDLLIAFGVRFDTWFSEQSLLTEGSVQRSIEELKERDFAYEKDGALWLKSTAFGDDKDRVIIKKDGEYTYLATDIAYHRNKLGRGFQQLVNIWGADHAGTVKRVPQRAPGLGPANHGPVQSTARNPISCHTLGSFRDVCSDMMTEPTETLDSNDAALVAGTPLTKRTPGARH